MCTESAAMYVRQRTEAATITEDVFFSKFTAQIATRLPSINSYTTAIIVRGGNWRWFAQVNSTIASPFVGCAYD
jgi:hypothetical protein